MLFFIKMPEGQPERATLNGLLTALEAYAGVKVVEAVVVETVDTRLTQLLDSLAVMTVVEGKKAEKAAVYESGKEDALAFGDELPRRVVGVQRMKTCPRCGDEFEVSRGKVRYCPNCREPKKPVRYGDGVVQGKIR